IPCIKILRPKYCYGFKDWFWLIFFRRRINPLLQQKEIRMLRVTSSFLLPMVGTMTVITTFMMSYVIRFGWRVAETFRKERLEDEYIRSDKTDA
ncbi:MAG: hypothetical protein ACRD5J_18890, partial [Nitrososphaeraceae archaeon]